jgi:hypothetical protein
MYFSEVSSAPLPRNIMLQGFFTVRTGKRRANKLVEKANCLILENVFAERKSGTLLQVRWTLRSCPWTPLVALLAVFLNRNRKEQQTFPRSTNPALVL